MTDWDTTDRGVSRRRLLLALSGAGTTTLAGCNGGSTSTDLPVTDTGPASPTPTRTPTDSPTPEPADLRLDDLAVPTPVPQFQAATVTATLANAGGSPFDGTVRATLDDRSIELRSVTVDAGETVTVETEFAEGVVGPHDLTYRVERDADGTVAAETARTVEVRRYPEHFVGVDGTEFTCGDGSLYLNGSNDQQVVATQIPESRIEAVFAMAADLGMNVMRVFGFGVPWSEQAAQPAPGEYNEAFFERFDRIVATAKRYGLRLIVPLVNDNQTVDSIARYVSWVDGASEHNDFYEMAACRRLYRDYVEHVLTRTNSLTGLEYREDPTIMMWELGNELNCVWPKKYPLDWVREMGAHVKALDDNHLLATGVRGLQWGAGDKQSWRDEITGETTMVKSNRPDVVDAVSIHYYPDPHMFDIEDPDGTLRDIVQAAHEMVGKPVYLGEFNWGVRLDEGESIVTRNGKLANWFEVAREERLNAAVVHEISTPKISRLKEGPRGTHNIVPEEDERTAEILRTHSQWARETSSSSCPGGTSR